MDYIEIPILRKNVIIVSIKLLNLKFLWQELSKKHFLMI